MMQRRGFTMIELLVTIGLLGAIAGLSLPGYASMQRKMALNGATQELADALRSAQTQAVSSKAGLNHGLRISANGYAPLQNPPQTVTVTVGSAKSLPSGITITTGAGSDTIFKRLVGDSIIANVAQSPASDLTIRLVSSTGSKDILVSQNGRVSIQ